MRAVQFLNGEMVVRDLARPVPQAGECLIRMSYAGICATDLEITRGYLDFQGTLGHEFVGVVEGGEARWRGRRVVGDINCACRICEACLRGDEHHCPSRSVLGIVGRDGAFADYLVLPAANLVEVPDEVSDQAATFTEPLAAALQIQEQVNLATVTSALVIGDGRLGCLIAMSLAQKGLNIDLLGRHPERSDLYAQWGLTFREEPPEKKYSLVVEATGNPGGLAVALDATAPRGTLVLKSTYAQKSSIDLSRVVVDEITLLGSRCGPIQKAVDLLASGEMDPSVLIQAEFSLSDGIQAFQRAASRGALKILLRAS